MKEKLIKSGSVLVLSVLFLQASYYQITKRNRMAVDVLKKDVKSVEKNLKQLISLDPYNIGSIAGLGQLYLKQGKKQEAIEKFREALAIDSGNRLA